MSQPTIDVHCHLATPATRDLVADIRKPEYEPYDYFMGDDSKDHNKVMIPSIVDVLSNAAPRIPAMDRMGVDYQGLATFVSEYFYWAPAEVAAKSARMQNEHLAQAVADFPDRYLPMGATVPMQDVDVAIAELDYAVDELGFHGLQIGGTVNEKNLDEPEFRPFWAAVEAKGVPVILHPNGYSESQRFGSYFMTNCIGNPLETMVAANRLIFSGLFEDHPNVKIVLLHGGGYLPFYTSRADHTWKVRPETRVKIPDRRPSDYMKMFYYDTMVFDPLYLRHLIEIVGSEHVMIGTDYPFDMGEEDPIGLVKSVDGLSSAEIDAITGGNAAALYGLDLPAN